MDKQYYKKYYMEKVLVNGNTEIEDLYKFPCRDDKKAKRRFNFICEMEKDNISSARLFSVERDYTEHIAKYSRIG